MKKIFYIIYTFTIIALFYGCTSDVMDILMSSTHTCQLQFNGGFSGYEDEPTTRAVVSVQNGAIMYLLFPNNVTGKATYNKGSWTLTYDGTIKEGACSAYYFSDIASETSTIVNLKKDVPIYGTTEGVCTIASNGDITVNAQLKPICPRVRFRGDANTTVTCDDSYQIYSKYIISTGKFETSSENLNSISIGSNGYSNYYYYTSMSSAITITINGTNYSAAIPFPTTPKSVCLNLPTKSNLNGWTKEGEGTEGDNMHNGHEYVDLGLPSGLKWATCNVGASKPEDYGDYFAWGATEEQTVYDWVHTPYQTQNTASTVSTRFTKYLGSTTSPSKDSSAKDADVLKTVLDPEDDAAHVNWEGSWRMPTKEEQNELRTKCTWTWGTKNGINGYTVVGPNGNSLFLPATFGSIGYYWSSSLYSNGSRYACSLYFYSDYVYSDCYYRYNGFAVRPVCQ